MGRLEETISGANASGTKALALFVTAGYPTLNTTVQLLIQLHDAGADLIEIGMPFSDPLADGPVIQQSSMTALRNGVTLARILDDVRSVRKSSDVPIVLMGYMNPILRFGPEKFFDTAARAGVDGVIIPELPLGEGENIRAMMRVRGLADILLVAPTSSPERVQAIDSACRGFLYCVSTTGVTGAGAHTPEMEYVRMVKREARRNKVLVGFGISTPDEARMWAGSADGVVVGSALLRKLAAGDPMTAVARWVTDLKTALKGA